MARPSSIDRLPKELRELIGRLREEGHTLNEILSKLRELGANVSHSALGRHTKTLAAVGERMRTSRMMAEALTARFGDQPDNQVARMNMELMHGMVFELITAAAGSEGEDGEPVTIDPQGVKFLAGALKDLSTAQKVDTDRMLKVEEVALKKAASRVDKTAKALGWSAETAALVRADILGVDPEKMKKLVSS